MDSGDKARLKQEALLIEYSHCQDEANSIAVRTQAVIVVVYTGSIATLVSGIGSTPALAHVFTAWGGFFVSLALMWPGWFGIPVGPVVFLQLRAEFTRDFMFKRQREIESDLGTIQKSTLFTIEDNNTASVDRFTPERRRNAGQGMLCLGQLIVVIWLFASLLSSAIFFEPFGA